MRKIIYLLTFVILAFSFSCVKQKMRFHEPELNNENYNIPNAITFFALYYKKHVKSTLETSDRIAITKEQRGSTPEQKYSRVVFANVNLQTGGGTGEGITKSRIVCIENYGLGDASGFNPYDYVLKSRFNYQENDLPIVVEYKVKNGDPANKEEVGRRQIEEAEINAFMRSGEYLYNLISPVQKLTNEKDRLRNSGNISKAKEMEERIKALSKSIVEKYASKIIVEFNLKNLRALYLNSQAAGGVRAVGSGSALAGSVGIFELGLDNGRKMIINVVYVPADIIAKMKAEPETKRYNFIIRFETSLATSIIVKPIVNFPDFPQSLDKEMLVVAYIRGLEHYQNVSTPSEAASSGSGETSSSSTAAGRSTGTN
jgi:hypothetical protein